jgi:hypothetical protein
MQTVHGMIKQRSAGQREILFRQCVTHTYAGASRWKKREEFRHRHQIVTAYALGLCLKRPIIMLEMDGAGHH